MRSIEDVEAQNERLLDLSFKAKEQRDAMIERAEKAEARVEELEGERTAAVIKAAVAMAAARPTKEQKATKITSEMADQIGRFMDVARECCDAVDDMQKAVAD